MALEKEVFEHMRFGMCQEGVMEDVGTVLVNTGAAIVGTA